MQSSARSTARRPGATLRPPDIDVLIPAYNEEAHIGRCLEHTLAQDYEGRYRILVVDAGSNDDTRGLARAWAERDRRVEVIGSDARLTTPAALNLGIEHSTAAIVARVDAHGYPEPDFLRRGAQALAEGGPEVACVGGEPRELGGSSFGRAFTLARGSSFGVGGSVYAARRRCEVDTVAWGMYRQEALARAGGFDPEMNHGEDEELNWRIRKLGYRIMFDPAIRFRYAPRSSLGGVFGQYRNYGRARARVVAAHPDFLRPRHAVPAVAVLGAASAGVAAVRRRSVRRVCLAVGAVYGVGAVSVAVQLTARDGLRLAPAVAACFPALHLGYGLGTLEGAARSIGSRLSCPNGPLCSDGP